MEDRRAMGRSTTAPSVIGTNGHFATANADNDPTAYEHGVQVIDEDKQFKYVLYSYKPTPPLLLSPCSFDNSRPRNQKKTGRHFRRIVSISGTNQ